MTTGYITITEFRNFTNTQQTEFSDSAVQTFIDTATRTIDLRTGRTWQAVNTVTDELYDGDDTDMLWLKQMDIVSLTALSIDQNGDNASYTTVTPAYCNTYAEGYLVLIRSKAEVNIFKAGTKTIKVSYTYGTATPTDDVKMLCLNMVRNIMHNDPERSKQIETLIQALKRKVSGLA